MDLASEQFENKRHDLLIVDDIPENLQLLGSLFIEQNIEVSFAMSGKQALIAIEYKKPDLILLDISMPEMTGLQLCSVLKDNEKTKDIPVIFITARNQTEDIVKGFEIGAVDYITKPFNSAELLARVNTHLKLKFSENIILEQNKKLKEMNETKDKFFSIIAHDLKHPFNTLYGFSEILLDNFQSFTPDKNQKYITGINRAAQAGCELLDNLLHWSRTQTGTLQSKPELFNISDVIKKEIDVLKPAAERKQINIYIEIKHKSIVFADPNMIATSFRNLLSNAIKFTPNLGFVLVSSEMNKNYVSIQIKDSGIGMSSDQISELFSVTRQKINPDTENNYGTGLGLIITKEFIEKNGGSLKVESSPGAGSTFIFTVPLQ